MKLFKIAWMLTRTDQILSKLEACTEERGMSRMFVCLPNWSFAAIHFVSNPN